MLMARIVLVTGGSRSGKSAFAQGMAERLRGPRAYVATCPVLDEEMRRRIQSHQVARLGKGWDTIEEPVDLCRVVRQAVNYRVLLVDCLTLWINNLLYEAEQAGRAIGEPEVERRSRAVLDACAEREGAILFVTNEVGWGIIPENALARRFRDLAGRCNQVMAARADAVVLTVCGIPLFLKGNEHDSLAE